MTEDELASCGRRNHGFSSSGSAFISYGKGGSRIMKCWTFEREGHKMNDCFYNSRSEKCRSIMRPSKKIEETLRKSNLPSESDHTQKDECQFAFIAQENPTSQINGSWTDVAHVT